MQMKDLLHRLRRDLPDTLGLLETLVNMDSPSPDKNLLDHLGRFVGSQFEAIGGRPEYVPSERFGDHLRVRFVYGTGEPILLLGHMDTVFSAGEASRRPFRIENDR